MVKLQPIDQCSQFGFVRSESNDLQSGIGYSFEQGWKRLDGAMVALIALQPPERDDQVWIDYRWFAWCRKGCTNWGHDHKLFPVQSHLLAEPLSLALRHADQAIGTCGQWFQYRY